MARRFTRSQNGAAAESAEVGAAAWGGATASPHGAGEAGGYSDRPLRTALVGYGYWGPNLARNIAELPGLELAALCDRDTSRALPFTERHPAVPVRTDLQDVLDDPDVDAVVVATPPQTHHALVRRALMAGKHVLVEKPLATTAADAEDLVEIATDRDLVLMPGHTFVYSPAVNVVRDLIQEDTLGEVYFCTSQRMNLGKYQADGVICDLAPHDLSILLYWLGRRVTQVSATARSVFQSDIPETAFLSLTFEGGAMANVQVSWLAPRKMRQMVVAGSRRMVAYDDTESDEPVRVYDRGLDFHKAPASFGEYQLTYRTGDVTSPRVPAAEPLRLELSDFESAIRTGSEPRSNAALGLEIVRVLEAAEISLRRMGEPVILEPALSPVGAWAA